ncbi:MAG TPA: ATP-binding cassette domain-containing protein [Acetobacteraceae bacterium]|jgi:ABC-type transporter Mla maintaining outer membrane lipid asymmetry ATPase subunit MlaF/ABC-type transporter Mla maintaining outer membrane lipid asymmetry permease subunit MlaE|nr:ATP-binding cassette domain-containing protein [Acetobacteraceae bacterium]
MSTGATIAVNGLSITSPAGVTLLRDVSLAVAPGEVVVVVGPSGSGKTSLIRLLCGLLQREAGGWQVSGTLHVGEREIDLSQGDSDVGGMVFQNHALFDDLSAGENLRIVADHADGDVIELSRSTGAMLADIDPAQSIMSCSGGQRQRLAIARTLLADPALLLFDEPNAGLDVGAAHRLVGLIRNLCRHSSKPAIVVAHHIDDFISLADRIMLLDPSTASLREVAVDRQAVEAAMLAIGAPDATGPALAAPAVNPWITPQPRRTRLYWFMRYFGEYLWLLFAAPSMLIYAILGSSIVGFVTVWFGFNYHSFGGYLRAILHDETLEGLGFVLTTVAVPFNTCILIIARNSAIIAADLGNRVSGMQLQAMRNLRLPGRGYIIASIMISLVVGSLILVALALVSAFFTSLVTWHFLFPGQATGYWQEYFFRKITDGHIMLSAGLWTVLKVSLSAILGGGAAVLVGLQPLRSSSQVAQLIATAIITGVSLTLMVHAALMILQF